MSGLMFVLRSAEETTEAVTIDPIVTEFSDLKVPVLSMVMMGLAAACILAALILGIYFLLDRTDNWGTGLLAGIAAYMVFCYLLYMGLQIGLNALPLTKDFVNDKPDQFTAMMTIFSGIFVCTAIILSLKYVNSQMSKRGQLMTIGTPLAVSVGMFTAMVLVNREMSTNIQYIFVSASVNKMGFDEAVTATVESMVNGGTYTLEEATKIATDSLHGLMTEPPISFFLNAIYYILMELLYASAAVLIFGEMDGRLERKWMFVGLGGVMLSIVPSILVTLTPFPNWAGVLVNLLITAAVVYITIKLVKQYMPEELKSLSYSHRRNRHKKDDDKPQKMPKIVMPDK